MLKFVAGGFFVLIFVVAVDWLSLRALENARQYENRCQVTNDASAKPDSGKESLALTGTNCQQQPSNKQDQTQEKLWCFHNICLQPQTWIQFLLGVIASFALYAANKSAKASRDQVAAVHSIGRKQLRAYVTVNGKLFVEQNPGANKPIEIRLDLKNAGQTPAYNVISSGEVQMLPARLSSTFDFSTRPAPGSENSNSTLGPHDETTLFGNADAVFTPDEMSKMKSGKEWRLYAWGVIHYKDVFKKKRWTNYCFWIELLPTNEAKWVRSEHHNDAT